MKFFKSLFGGSGDEVPKEEEVVVYKGFNIQPAPKNAGNGWTTEAVISMEKDDETLTHHFIRADTTANREGAVQLTVSKAQVMIDQAGESIFKR